MSKRPPLGLTPKAHHQRSRFIEVSEAIKRYWDAGVKIPVAWIDEYNELVETCFDPVLDEQPKQQVRFKSLMGQPQ